MSPQGSCAALIVVLNAVRMAMQNNLPDIIPWSVRSFKICKDIFQKGGRLSYISYYLSHSRGLWLLYNPTTIQPWPCFVLTGYEK
jgi:hypothetical protein